MKKYTTIRDNHYIQAAWVGEFWGENNNEDPRNRKVWALDISGIFKEEYNSWPAYNILKEKKWLNNYHKAENIYQSNNLLLDNLDVDFAYETESFLQSVKEIEEKIISHHKNGDIRLASPYSVEENLQKINELKSYICLHLARTKLAIINSYKRIEVAIIDSNYMGFQISFPKMPEKELDYLNKNLVPLTSEKYKEAKKIISYYDIKNNYDSYMDEISNYKHIKFTVNVSKSKNKILENNFVTEVPFINGHFLNNEHKEVHKNDFINFIKKNTLFNGQMENDYGKNYLKNSIFIKDLDDLFSNFIVGVISHRIKIFISEKENSLSNILNDWLIGIESNIYEMLVIQNTFSKFICNSLEAMEKCYELISNIDFNIIKKQYKYVNDMIKYPKTLEELLEMKKKNNSKHHYKYRSNYKYYNIYSYNSFYKYKLILCSISINIKYHL